MIRHRVADALDAITSDLLYRDARSCAVAVEEIIENRGAQFDPQVVDALLRARGHDGAAKVKRVADSVA